MSTELARAKAATAWTRPSTSHIQFDPVLAEAFASLLDEVWSEPWLGNATTAQLLAELQARAEIGGYADYKPVDSD